MSKRKEKEGFEKSLLTYSMTAAGRLALATGADSAVVHSGNQNLLVSSGSSVSINVNGDGTPDFRASASTFLSTFTGNPIYIMTATLEGAPIDYITTTTSSYSYTNYYIRISSATGGRGWRENNGYVANVSNSQTISTEQPFVSGVDTFASSAFEIQYGNFPSGGPPGFIDMKFDARDNTHFNWIQFQNNRGGSGTIIDWAYEDVPDRGILTGATNGTLPITFSEFSATPKAAGVALHWRTEFEVNNVGFNIYRATKKEGPFSKFGFAQGHGSTAIAHEYRFIDDKADAGGTYFYLTEDIDIEGTTEYSEVISIQFEPQPIAKALPTGFGLYQNFPNPFNPEPWIPFQIPQDAPITIHIYNLNGQVVRTLPLGRLAAGHYNERSTALHWDDRSDTGEAFPSGVYFYRLEAGAFSAVRKMVVLKLS